MKKKAQNRLAASAKKTKNLYSNKISPFINKNKYKIIFVLCLVIFNIFAIARVIPQNCFMEMNELHITGDVDRKVFNVFYIVGRRNAHMKFLRPNLFIFADHNPALFMVVIEIFIRLGAKNSLPVQILAIIMFNIGFFAHYNWIRLAFKSKLTAILSIIFLTVTPYLFFHSSSIHQEPYNFLFLGLSLFFGTKYLIENRKKYWLLTLISYFLLCQDYYMYYVSGFLLLLGLFSIFKKPLISKKTLTLALIPIVSILLIIVQLTITEGGISAGTKKLTDAAVTRSFEIKNDNVEFQQGEKYMDKEAYLNYPQTISNRVKFFFYLGIEKYLLLLGITFLISRRKKINSYKFMFFAVPAGLSWFILMMQHTYLHEFSGIYSFFLWTLIFSFFYTELYFFLRRKLNIKNNILIFFIIALLSSTIILEFSLGFLKTYVQHMYYYLKNIIS